MIRPVETMMTQHPETTYPKLLVQTAGELKQRVALREKSKGIWKEITWDSYLEKVRHLALGLEHLGLNRGDHVSILAENSPRWVYADLAIQSLSAVSVGIYPTSSSEQVKYIVEHSQSKFIFVGDQEQADKVLEIREEVSGLEALIVFNPKGMRHYTDPIINTCQSIIETGAATDKKQPDRFYQHVRQTRSEDTAFLIYTSGTTGPPKGCMIPHRNHISNVLGMNEVFRLSRKDSVVSYLPLCHILERSISVCIPLVFGYSINFAESVDTVQENIREISPTFFAAVPRILEKMHSTVHIKLKETTTLKRFCWRIGYPIGKKAAGYRMAKKRLPLPWFVAYLFAYITVFRSLREKLGLLSCRLMMSGGAPIAPEILSFYHVLGVFAVEMWSQTESCGGGTGPHSDVKPGSVGQPVSSVQLKLAEDGEILINRESAFAGYHRDPKATEEVLQDGWLHTGDIGQFDEDGHLYIVDRKKDIIITSGGKNISPSEIENTMKCSPYIKEAIVIGDGRKYLTALIQLETDNVGKWAQSQKIPYTNYKSLARNEEVSSMLSGEITEINMKLARVEQIKKFYILEKELDQDDEELTATQKVKRKVIEQRFKGEIESLYQSV